MAKFCFAFFVISLIAYVTTRENFELENPSTLLKFVCNLTRDLVEVDKSAKTIAIIKFDSAIPDKFIDDVGQCLPKEVTVVVMDFKKEEVPLGDLKVSLVIVMAENIKRV